MKRSAGLLMICATLSLSAGPTVAGTPWENYVAKPSPQNARKVQAIGYGADVPAEGLGEQTTADIQVLAVQVYSGDREAFQLTLRVMSSTDGANLEDLAEIAGRFVRQNPKAYLEDVLASGQSAWCPGAKFVGLQYVDRDTARAYEVKARIKALMTVRNEKLRTVRDTCVSLLKE